MGKSEGFANRDVAEVHFAAMTFQKACEKSIHENVPKFAEASSAAQGFTPSRIASPLQAPQKANASKSTAL